MKRSLLLMRHAKSDWEASSGDDHDRPLASRGRRDGARLGRFLARTGPRPEQTLASDARRTDQTAQLLEEAGALSGPAGRTRDLYLALAENVQRLVQATSDAVPCLLLVLHEPTVSDLVRRLSGARVRIPTAALVRLDFEGSWQDLGAGRCTLRWLVTPKLVGAAFPDL